jgi:protein-tyrosine-phosphatase/DNA-binding HxlR family transcriptional regulator
MDTERSDKLAQRVVKHAALADQARLLITDKLAEGDASPSELGALLAMPSNLLAHHLRVLEDARIITRRRSEGDHRRSYLRLVPGALDSLTALRRRTASRVLFVCTANSARSHLAAALWRQASPVPATSAGTHPADVIHPGALDAARRHELRLPQRRPQHFGGMLEDGDLIITVCDRAREELGQLAALHWSVPDPVPAGDRGSFDAALDDLSRRVGQLARQVSKAPRPALLARTPATQRGN